MSDKPINLNLPGITTPSNLQATFFAGGTAGHLTSYGGSASYHKDFSSGAFAGGSGSTAESLDMVAAWAEDKSMHMLVTTFFTTNE